MFPLQHVFMLYFVIWIHSDLSPVGGDDANVFGWDGSQASLAMCLQQFLHVVHQHLHLCYIKEWWATGLTLINTSHTMEDHWEVLRERGWEIFRFQNVNIIKGNVSGEPFWYIVFLWGGKNKSIVLQWKNKQTLTVSMSFINYVNLIYDISNNSEEFYL